MRRPWRFATLFSIVFIAFPGCLCAAGVAGGSQAPTCSRSHRCRMRLRPIARLPQPQSARPSRPSQPRARPVRPIRRLPAQDADTETRVQSRRRPRGSVQPDGQRPSSGYDETSGIIRVNVNAVPVPVTVKDASGRLFPGLTKDNFSVYEDGVKQRISFFTSDPFPVSAAIVIDVGMPEIALRKIKETFAALVGSFSQFDELAVYTYGTTVKQQQDYLAALGDTTELP